MDSREKLLFVCSRNQWRSPTAQAIFKNSRFYEARSAGTETGARIKITAGLLHWADWIFVMEKRHLARLRQKYPDALPGRSVVTLHIPDAYEFMDAELLEILHGRLAEYLDLDEI